MYDVLGPFRKDSRTELCFVNWQAGRGEALASSYMLQLFTSPEDLDSGSPSSF